MHEYRHAATLLSLLPLTHCSSPSLAGASATPRSNMVHLPLFAACIAAVFYQATTCAALPLAIRPSASAIVPVTYAFNPQRPFARPAPSPRLHIVDDSSDSQDVTLAPSWIAPEPFAAQASLSAIAAAVNDDSLFSDALFPYNAGAAPTGIEAIGCGEVAAGRRGAEEAAAQAERSRAGACQVGADDDEGQEGAEGWRAKSEDDGLRSSSGTGSRRSAHRSARIDSDNRVSTTTYSRKAPRTDIHAYLNTPACNTPELHERHIRIVSHPASRLPTLTTTSTASIPRLSSNPVYQHPPSIRLAHFRPPARAALAFLPPPPLAGLARLPCPLSYLLCSSPSDSAFLCCLRALWAASSCV
ncbi:hypothetical protein AAT19DRAFT_12948 [Rhodotorula toruloides]|uniref:Proteophosphoglycan ppg4 n=1 Tax=Rhodotorula toruloides TaxID=5286 RepID=A0A2T0AD40_RHOTO|nr:hypothetical protein AAT19DRAFT_12948 [Rhodotorula toruloides]